MSREVRRVPANWQHPQGHNGRPIPMFEGDFEGQAREWMANAMAWENGTHPDAAANKAAHPFYWEWSGGPPERETYMPAWPDSERTHYQMYETTSEGTPISPVMESPEVLARWLADSGASAFGSSTAGYAAWLRICQGGCAPSAVSFNGGPLVSGVEGLAHLTGDDS